MENKIMKMSFNLKFAVMFAILFSITAAAQETKPTLQSLAFISGCWEINTPEKKRLVSEQWMSPAGDVMMGMSRTIRNGKLSNYEYLRIVEDANGINYISRPSENKEDTAFKLVKWAANEAVFENPTHDFPQRIIYKLSKPDALWARIEGSNNGKFLGIDFPMNKVRCG